MKDKTFFYIAGAIATAGLFFLLKKEKPMIYGSCVHGSHYVDVEGMKEMGLQMVRDDLSWSAVEKQKGVYDFSWADERVDKLRKNGIVMNWLLLYSNNLYNSYELDPSCIRPGVYVPRDPEEFEIFKKAYGNYVYESVKHYKGRVKYFEIWNEPNGFWEPRENDEYQAMQYIELLKEAYVRAKQANPDCIIVSAGIGVWSGLREKYIQGLYRYGAKDYFDILAIHPYCSYDYEEENSLEEQGFRCGRLNDIYQIKQIMDINGDGNKDIWITEFGYPTMGCYKDRITGEYGYCPTNLNEENQYHRLINFFKTLEKDHPYVKAVFWYDYRDDGDDPLYTECHFGLTRRDSSRKPAWYAYQEIINNI